MNDEELVIIVIAGFFILAILAVALYFYSRQQKILDLIQIENRTLPPGQVWLYLIPCFGTIWIFIVIDRIGESLRNELRFRRIQTDESKPTVSYGMWYAGLAVAGAIPYIGLVFSLASLVLFILYWVELEKYIKILSTENYGIETLDAPIGYIED